MLGSALELQEWMCKRGPALSSSPGPEGLASAGAQKALDLFRAASVHVPAYRDFLKSQNFDPRSIDTIHDLGHIPATSKENYISRYNLADRCWDGGLEHVHLISSSSGTSGKMHFWPRTLRTDIEGAIIYEQLYREVFGLDHRRTLLLDAFALGNGIAGTFTLAGANLLSWKGYQLTTMTPGYSLDDVVPLLQSVAPAFEQTIIAGMSPFLKEVLEMADAQGLDFTKLRIRLTGAGQGFSEEWRQYILSLLRADDYCHSVINIYGSADAALMGFETPHSISLRAQLSRQPELIRDIFKEERLPSLFNYDPSLTFFDAEHGELHVTKDGGVPLIRYNIYDVGGILPSYAFACCTSPEDAGAGHPASWHLPFVYLFGRDKFMVKFFGANIYPENVQTALNRPELQPVLTGRCQLEVSVDESHTQQLQLRVELSTGALPSHDLAARVQDAFVTAVAAVNREYSALTKIIGRRAWPAIQFIENGDAAHFPAGRKTS
jgi:phenylacetate-CoA ligase